MLTFQYLWGMEDWRKKLRRLKESQGLSVRELARRANLSAQSLERWIRQEPIGSPDIDEAFRLARALGVDLNTLADPEVDLPSTISVQVKPLDSARSRSEAEGFDLGNRGHRPGRRGNRRGKGRAG